MDSDLWIYNDTVVKTEGYNFFILFGALILFAFLTIKIVTKLQSTRNLFAVPRLHLFRLFTFRAKG